MYPCRGSILSLLNVDNNQLMDLLLLDTSSFKHVVIDGAVTFILTPLQR